MLRCSFVLLLGIILLSGCDQKRVPVSLDRKNVDLVKQGELVYNANCARCHGANLAGQPNWRARKPDGKLPAPPHDASGHTWHHPNAVLLSIVRDGLVPPNAPEGYQSDMPAFKKTLTEAQIVAVLSFIQSRWPDDIWQYRTENRI